MKKFFEKNKLIVLIVVLIGFYLTLKTAENFTMENFSNNNMRFAQVNFQKKENNCNNSDLLRKSHANKCYDCEEQLAGGKDSYKSQKSKCYSCEEQVGFYGQPSKCFDCEDQLAKKESDNDYGKLPIRPHGIA